MKIRFEFLGIILGFITGILCGACIYIPLGAGCITEVPEEAIFSGILQSLQTAAAIYVAQQGKPPEIFSDFVINNGKIKGQYTMSLGNIQNSIKEIKGYKSSKLVLVFKKKLQATYYLNGSDITANFQK